MKNVIITSCLSALLFSNCGEVSQSDTKHPEFPVTTLSLTDTSAYTEYTAEINAVQNVELRARVSGYLERIHIDEGNFVQKDQLLFSINDLEYKEELSKAIASQKNALAELGNAEIEVKSVKQLFEKNVVSKAELDIAINELESAKARLGEANAVEATARLRLSCTQMKAPFSGKVNRISHKAGSLIEEGTLLTTISQDNEVFAYFHVSEKEYLNYAFNIKNDSLRSKEVSLVLANGKEHSDKGMIETIESEIDRNTGSIAFRARFGNPENLLKHGASGKIRLMKKYNNVLVIPQKSTFEIQDKLYVYVVDKENIVRSRAVTAVNPLPHLFIVSSGLSPGDKIIYEGIQNAKEGIKIAAKPVSMPEIMKQLAKR